MSRRAVIPILMFLAAGLVCLAQVEQGAITGAVTDATGASYILGNWQTTG